MRCKRLRESSSAAARWSATLAGVGAVTPHLDLPDCAQREPLGYARVVNPDGVRFGVPVERATRNHGAAPRHIDRVQLLAVYDNSIAAARPRRVCATSAMMTTTIV